MSSKCCDQDFDFTFYGLRLFCSPEDWVAEPLEDTIPSRYAVCAPWLVSNTNYYPSFKITSHASTFRPPDYLAPVAPITESARIHEGDEFVMTWNDTFFGTTRKIYFSLNDSVIETPQNRNIREYTESAEGRVSITRVEDFIGNRFITRRYLGSTGTLISTKRHELFATTQVDYSFGPMSVKIVGGTYIPGSGVPESLRTWNVTFVYSFSGHVRFHSSGELAPRV